VAAKLTKGADDVTTPSAACGDTSPAVAIATLGEKLKLLP
jgi:hypothetical protein